MALAKKKDTNGNNHISIATSSIVDIEEPIIKSVQYLEDGNWTIKGYYQQSKREDDYQTNIDVKDNKTDNAYTVVKNVSIRVTSPVESGEVNKVGFTAVLPPQIVPIVGDVIVTNTISGELGMFRIQEFETQSYNRRPVYTITCKLTALERTDTTRFKNLESKVIRTLLYDKDAYVSNSAPIITTETMSTKHSLQLSIASITRDYSRFINKRNRLLMSDGCYDPGAVMLFMMIADISKVSQLKKVSNHNYIDNEYFFNSLPSSMLEKVSLDNITLRKWYPLKSSMIHNDNPYVDRFRTITEHDIGHNVVMVDKQMDIKNKVERHPLLPQHKVNDNTYLVTKEFYEKKHDSVFESMLHKYFDNEKMDALQTLLASYEEFNDLDKYQYAPYLLAMAHLEISLLGGHSLLQ